MTTRRTFVSSATLLASVTASLTAAAQTAAQDAKQADYLFVQTANAMSFDKATNKLTLRPERIAGNMKTSAFVPFWSQGKDSFLSDPPNADISVVEGKELRQIVAVLKSPELNGGDLSYTVKILQGEMPAKAEEVSVFIDVIGMPMTPVSYAGVARRSYRRAVIR
jgi:hypothetical protein